MKTYEQLCEELESVHAVVSAQSKIISDQAKKLREAAPFILMATLSERAKFAEKMKRGVV